jgi:aconitate hydratase
MGVLPLQFLPGESATSLGISGVEIFYIRRIDESLSPGSELDVTMIKDDGASITFKAIVKLYTQIEVDYYHNGGVLNTILINMQKTNKNEY